jgi:hypothetical protein
MDDMENEREIDDIKSSVKLNLEIEDFLFQTHLIGYKYDSNYHRFELELEDRIYHIDEISSEVFIIRKYDHHIAHLCLIPASKFAFISRRNKILSKLHSLKSNDLPEDVKRGINNFMSGSQHGLSYITSTYVCERCDNYALLCEDDRCRHCGEHIEDCNCQRCEYCEELTADCGCEFCAECSKIMKTDKNRKECPRCQKEFCQEKCYLEHLQECPFCGERKVDHITNERFSGRLYECEHCKNSWIVKNDW